MVSAADLYTDPIKLDKGQGGQRLTFYSYYKGVEAKQYLYTCRHTHFHCLSQDHFQPTSLPYPYTSHLPGHGTLSNRLESSFEFWPDGPLDGKQAKDNSKDLSLISLFHILHAMCAKHEPHAQLQDTLVSNTQAGPLPLARPKRLTPIVFYQDQHKCTHAHTRKQCYIDN